ncbi:MAG: MFS transporter [Nitrososphaeria archaeon]
MDDKTRTIYMTIVLIGVVSMMGDIVYEGGKGLVPDYLRFLGASALAVGAISGLGDFIGYALRLVSGYLTDERRMYWEFMFLGYGLVVAIPMLSLTNVWSVAATLVVLERVGKAVRSPARDTIVSIVSKGVGVGKAFGLHEMLDQVGAVIGPLFVSALMYFTMNSYSTTFGTLFVPYFALLLILFFMYTRIRGKVMEGMPRRVRVTPRFSRGFYFYTFAVGANILGLVHVSLILYKASIILNPVNEQWIVPLLFMLIQLIDAPTALISGIWFDKYGLKILFIPFALSVIPTLLVYQEGGLFSLILASIFFGAVLGMQESIYRAAVTSFAPAESRGTAYGLFNTIYGMGFLASGAVFGLFLDYSIIFSAVLAYSLILQTTAIGLLFKSIRSPKPDI